MNREEREKAGFNDAVLYKTLIHTIPDNIDEDYLVGFNNGLISELDSARRRLVMFEDKFLAGPMQNVK